MDKSKNLIIILVILVVVLVIALAGAIFYIATDKNDGTVVQNKTENNVEENIMEEYENTIGNVTEDVTENEVVENEIPNDENVIIGDEEVNPLPDEDENSATDMEKLIFNTKFIPYLGNITGENLNKLLEEIAKNNNTNSNHVISLSSNNLSDLNGIVATDTYTITFTYGEDGYISNINIDKKV